MIATGATVPRELRVPGKELGGVHVAMEFLHQANAVAAGKPVADQITAAGKHVIIIGGGDTGSDCLGTALRQGAASVTTLAIGKRPPLERPAHQPWPTDPILFEVSSSHAEGGDRDYLASTVEFVGDESGTVRALTLATTEYLSDGRRVPTPGTEREIPADLVLVAMGFTGPEVGPAHGADRHRAHLPRARRPHRRLRDDRSRRVRRGRRRPRAVAHRVGDRRGPRSGGRGRHLPLGQHGAARPGHRHAPWRCAPEPTPDRGRVPGRPQGRNGTFGPTLECTKGIGSLHA